MKRLLLPSVLLVSLLVAGCQKDVKEVRAAEAEKEAVS